MFFVFFLKKEKFTPGRAGLIVALQRDRGINEKKNEEGSLVAMLAAYCPNPFSLVGEFTTVCVQVGNRALLLPQPQGSSKG